MLLDFKVLDNVAETESPCLNKKREEIKNEQCYKRVVVN